MARCGQSWSRTRRSRAPQKPGSIVRFGTLVCICIWVLAVSIRSIVRCRGRVAAISHGSGLARRPHRKGNNVSIDPAADYRFTTTTRLDGEKEIDVDEREAIMKVSVKLTKPKRTAGPRWELVDATLVLEPHELPPSILLESLNGDALRFPLNVKSLLLGKPQEVPVVVRTGIFAGKGAADPGSAKPGTHDHVDVCVEAEFKPVGPFHVKRGAGKFPIVVAED